MIAWKPQEGKQSVGLPEWILGPVSLMAQFSCLIGSFVTLGRSVDSS